MNTVRLTGCRPAPLAHYLKALGIFRVVSEQLDSTIRVAWREDVFELLGRPTLSDLVHFLLHDYRPTPVLSPWNGGSGFYPKDAKDAWSAIQEAESDRFAPYRESIAAAVDLLERVGVGEKPNAKDKATLLEACRASLPDAAMPWLDAAFVLTGEGAKFPPLLGTGGNDGRLEFSNNFMQRLLDLFDPDSGEPREKAEAWLRAALIDVESDGLQKGKAIGQFLPGSAGGVNASASFESDSLINPWDFILMIEGAMLFAAACVRRLGEMGPGILVYPFTVRQNAVGYGSAALDDQSSSRAEMWLPLWRNPAGLSEVSTLFAEGRVQVGRRLARDGIDFARAIAGLGVDRGLSEFQRYGFQVRNGLSYFATPLGRFEVVRRPEVDLLMEIDTWLDSFRGKALASTAPSSARSAAGELDRSVFELCKGASSLGVQRVLGALGRCERTMAKSRRWADSAFLRPIPPLSARWPAAIDFGSREARLAAALASVFGVFDPAGRRIRAIRENMEPTHRWGWKKGAASSWVEEAGRDVVWQEGDLIGSLGGILLRRLLLAQKGGLSCSPDAAHRVGWMADNPVSSSISSRFVGDRGRFTLGLADVAAFIRGDVNDARIEELLWGFILLDWPDPALSAPPPVEDDIGPGPLYSAMKLCLNAVDYRGEPLPLSMIMPRQALAGDGPRAGAVALARLRVSGLTPSLAMTPASPPEARRSAAALLIPLSRSTVGRLAPRIVGEIEEVGHSERGDGGDTAALFV